MIFFVSIGAYCFEISKPRIFFDRNNYSVLVIVFVEGSPPRRLDDILKRNFSVEFTLELNFIRKDFGVFNIQTVITNIKTRYSISYDIVSGKYITSNPFTFRTYDNFEDVIDGLSPFFQRIDLKSFKGNPDFEEIYEDTEFFITSKARITYINLKPPLSIITSLIGFGNYETPTTVSDTFRIR
ncbi:MAG: hypothetical protein RMJ37_02195 [Spirochaetia bacterium]|nr:hypothetical protein [Spirochaetota bacterium]MDW8112136.1 hypothetical protein [Spirochaetia bacterium]